MKRYTKYIVTLVVALMAVACTFTDIDQIVTPTVSGGAGFSIVSRVISYTDYDVATRAPKDPAENNITMADYVIMNNDQKCIFYAHSSNTVLTLDKTALADQFAKMPDSLTLKVNDRYTKLTNCSVYVIANYPEVKAAVDAEGGNIIGKGLDFFQAIKSDVKGVTLPTSGLPMIGVHGEGANVDFSNPKLDNITAGTTFVANLVCLYAKIAFTIDVEAIQTTPNKPTFTLESFAVSNLAKTVDMWPGQENGDGETVDDTEVYDKTFSGDLTGNLTTIHGGTPITFYCYLPERFLKDGDASAFEYPFGMGSSILEEDNEEDNEEKKEYKKYLQRYKPLLAQGYTKYNKTGETTGDREATYVTLNGVYTTHQGHSYDVSYDIYVGNNNYSNFDIVRNRQYNNSVTIKGIDTSHNNNSTELDAVSVDHRVNVSRTQSVIINLRRETLLDSHFEVRPMRIRKNSNDTSGAKYVKVSVDKQWVRLERSFGNTSATTLDSNASKSDTYIDSNNGSKGKRKYFTTDLVTSTTGGNSVVVPIDDSNQTVWIYVDENTEDKDGDFRSATVTITSYADAACEQEVGLEPIIYTLNQHELFKITANSRTYYIEYEEEYLHNFDAEDAFFENDKPTTQIQGMPWGLNGMQLSKEHFSYDSTRTPNVDWAKYETKGPRPYYDFYTWQQDSVVLKEAGIAQTDIRSHNIGNAGQHFTEAIAKNTNARVKNLTLEEQASGAVEYCYNRNKRNSDGSIAKVEWYLPSANELEEFIVPAYGTFKEFQDNYYWTSQPAYIRNVFYYEYQSGRFSSKTVTSVIVYDDNPKYARASKVARKDGAFEPVPSGLDFDPTPYVNRAPSDDYTNLGYFDKMHYYKHYYESIISGLTEVYGIDKNKDENITKDEKYTHNGSYFAHLNIPVETLITKTTDGEYGYHERTRNNRVRCVRKMN